MELNELQLGIRTAIGEWAYAMLLLDTVQKGVLTVTTFPKNFEVRTLDEKGHVVGQVLHLTSPLTEELLHRYHENFARMATGSCAMKTSAILEKKFGKDPGKVREPNARAAFTVLKCARHGWAHQPQSPTWQVQRKEDRKPWTVEPIKLTVDLTQADGRPIDGRDFGGWAGFYHLVMFCDWLVAEQPEVVTAIDQDV